LQQPIPGGGHAPGTRRSLRTEFDAAWLSLSAVARKEAPRGFEVVERERELFEVIATLGLAGSFTSGLYRRQQQRHEDANDRNDDQKLYQGETVEGGSSVDLRRTFRV
jgi:hypothetical protein